MLLAANKSPNNNSEGQSQNKSENPVIAGESKEDGVALPLTSEQKVNTEKPKDYKIIKREANAEVTDESLNALVDYATAKNVYLAESKSSPVKSIKILFKDDGITIDIDRMKKTYSIGDVATFQKQLEEKVKKTAKEVTLRVLVAPGLKKENLSKIVSAIIQDESARDKEADQLFIFAYDKEEDAKNESDALALVRWGPKDKKLTEKVVEGNDRSNYETEWQYESGRLSNPSVGSSEVSDRERGIFYRYWELIKSSDLGYQEASAKAKTIAAKEFSISEDDASSISDKVMESKPTDFEIKVSDALQKKFDEKGGQDGLLSNENENQAMKEVAKTFDITLSKLDAIWAHVTHWEGKRN